MNTIKLHRFSILAIALMLTVTASAAAGTITDRYAKTFPVETGGELELENVNGSVAVSTWSRSEVRIVAEIKVRGSGTAARKAMDEIRIDVDHNGRDVRVETVTPRGHDGLFSWLTGSNVGVDVHYEVTVPARYDVNVGTVNGSIEARGLDGRIRLGSTNGKIRLYESKGSVQAATTNGTIRAELREVSSAPMRLSTTNGGITLVVPGTFRADIDASTTNGSIATDFPVTTSRFRKTRVEGTINGGGPELRLRTTNGSIRLEAGG